MKRDARKAATTSYGLMLNGNYIICRVLKEKSGRIALAHPRFDFDRKSDDLMEELNERFPGKIGRETTSL